ncbi:MAG: HupE/UreJ family protein [Rhodoferax sp.]|nr:HupE/UreJ family protein [Rhodoferax sp.]
MYASMRCVNHPRGWWASLVRRAMAALALAVWVIAAHAHKASDAYLQLEGGAGSTSLRIDVALRDLDVALNLDTNGDGKLTWGEIRLAWPLIEAYLRTRVELVGCPLEPVTHGLERRIDGVYAALTLQSTCKPGLPPGIRYGVMDDVDPTHRGIARISWAGQPGAVRVLVPQAVRVGLAGAELATAAGVSAPLIPNPATVVEAAPTVKLAAPPAAPAEPEQALQFVREGVQHILTGYDHVLFLVCLLLPSVLRRTEQGWQPVPRLKSALIPLIGIVTAFTLAHSLTLALAATGIVNLAPAFIEPAIAVTITLAALDNLWPIFRGRRVLVTFFFGLIHGFGYASVLSELQLPAAEFAWALLQFNLGLELGQLLIVALVTVLLFTLRSQRAYPKVFVRGGSLLAMGIASVWFVERVANVSLLPL